MGEASINGELTLTFPESFNVMSVDELKKAYASDYENIWGIHDKEHHIIFTIAWKNSGELLSRMASSKSLAKRAERILGKTLKKTGYRCGGFFTTKVAGEEAHGFTYAYKLNEAPQDAETIVFKRRTSCYTLYYYTRPECAIANRPTHDGILASLSFKNA